MLLCVLREQNTNRETGNTISLKFEKFSAKCVHKIETVYLYPFCSFHFFSFIAELFLPYLLYYFEHRTSCKHLAILYFELCAGQIDYLT